MTTAVNDIRWHRDTTHSSSNNLQLTQVDRLTGSSALLLIEDSGVPLMGDGGGDCVRQQKDTIAASVAISAAVALRAPPPNRK